LHALIESACADLGAEVKAGPILAETQRNLYDGVPLDEVYKSAILAARAMIEKDPAYAYVTARLLLHTVRREVLGEEVTQAQMQTRYAEYFPQFIKYGIEAELLDEKLGLFDLKHDRGGMVDVEFIVQYLVLARSHGEPRLLGNLGNIALLRIAGELGLIEAKLAGEVGDAYRRFRKLQHGLRLNNAEFAPFLGMERSGLLQDRAKRRKYGLPVEQRMPKLGDAPSRQFNYLRHDADFATADITISTVADQTPIAPGYKVSDVTRDGRRTARFVTEAPVLPFSSIRLNSWSTPRQRESGPRSGIARMLLARGVPVDFEDCIFHAEQLQQSR
jgi:hypothetical protein